MNHFAEAERLLAKADDCVVPSLTRNFVQRATVHAQLAQVQAMEAAFDLQPAVVDAHVCETSDCCRRPAVVDGWPDRTPPVQRIQTLTPTTEVL